MTSIGQKIVERENLLQNINRLAAQKEIYYDAKRLFTLQVVLTVGVTILLTVINLILSFFEYNIDYLRAGYGIVLTIVELFLIKFMNKYRQKAASIQELFDCDVLDIEWNKVLVGDKPTSEDIKKYSDKHLARVKSIDKLKTWYDEPIKEADGVSAKIICQLSNFSYDYGLREKFLHWVVGISIGTLTLLFFLALFNNFSLRSSLTTVILPFVPIFTLSAKLYNDHNASIKVLERLKSNLTKLWSSVLDGTAINPEKTVRQIQDEFYRNRKSNPLIPEWIYNRIRPSAEAQMHYGVVELIDEYKSTRKV